MPVIAPALKAMSRPAARPCFDACGGADVGAHRDVHADIAGGGRQHGADDEADGDVDAEGDAQDDQDHHADDADGGVLPVQVGAGALLHGGGDLLHAGGAGVRGQHLPAGDEAVDQRQQTAGDDHDVGQLHVVVRSLLRPEPARCARRANGEKSARGYAR